MLGNGEQSPTIPWDLKGETSQTNSEALGYFRIRVLRSDIYHTIAQANLIQRHGEILGKFD